MKKEMLANNIASAGSIFWRIIVQLLIPPALIGWWGAERYGEWLYISSLPTLLSVADLGFADAAASQMTMEIAKGNKSEASRIFQSISAMTLVMCFLLVAAGLPLLFFDEFKIGMAQFDKEAMRAAFILVCYSSLLVLSNLLLACLRAGRLYAQSTLIHDALQFLEGVGLLFAAYAGKSFVFCGLILMSLRTINVVVLMSMIFRRMSWLRWGLSSFEMKALQELLAPALAAMAMPVALALNFQGMIWIAGSAIGPAAAAVLSTVRTASRVIIQIIGIFSRAAMPIYSASVAVNNERSRDKIERTLRLLTYFFANPGLCSLWYIWSPVGLYLDAREHRSGARFRLVNSSKRAFSRLLGFQNQPSRFYQQACQIRCRIGVANIRVYPAWTSFSSTLWHEWCCCKSGRP